ncbi:MAG: hypothetical protein GY820_45705 [Gammaproteobacteria bacterium]|nr:hypothetical protein [Gammaproteobacteria bacterium]
MNFLRSIIADARTGRVVSASQKHVMPWGNNRHRSSVAPEPVSAVAESNSTVSKPAKASQAIGKSKLSSASNALTEPATFVADPSSKSRRFEPVNTLLPYDQPARINHEVMPETQAVEPGIKSVEMAITTEKSQPVTEYNPQQIVRTDVPSSSELTVEVETRTTNFDVSQPDPVVSIDQSENIPSKTPVADEAESLEEVVPATKTIDQMPLETASHFADIPVIEKEADIEVWQQASPPRPEEFQPVSKPDNIASQTLVEKHTQRQAELVAQLVKQLSTSSVAKPKNQESERANKVIISKVPDSASLTQPQSPDSKQEYSPPDTPLQARLQESNSFLRNGDGFATNPSSAVVSRPDTASVKIGQVDVFIEAPGRKRANTSMPQPSSSFSSQHYLRRP